MGCYVFHTILLVIIYLLLLMIIVVNIVYRTLTKTKEHIIILMVDNNKILKNGIGYRTNYFFGEMININDFNPKNIKVDKKDILIYYIGYETSDRVKPFYFIIYKINGYIEDNNGMKYLTLVPVEASKGGIKKYKEI